MSELNTQHNRAVWIDIPVRDVDRASAFYKAVLDISIHRESMGNIHFAVLEHDQGNGGCLVPKPDEISATHGILVYLNVDGRIRDAVAKVAENGGQVTQEIHSIGPHGFRAIITDSEGNRVALHSESDQ